MTRACQVHHIIVSFVDHVPASVTPNNPDHISPAAALSVIIDETTDHDARIRPIIITERLWLERYEITDSH